MFSCRTSDDPNRQSFATARDLASANDGNEHCKRDTANTYYTILQGVRNQVQVDSKTGGGGNRKKISD